MGSAKGFGSEMAVVGVLTTVPERDAEVDACLEGLLGPVAARTGPGGFTWTDYYTREMGPGILRRYLAFDRLVDPGLLPAIKIATNRLEARFSEGGNRKVNIDPGLLAPGRFVLATTKDRAHRIPLSDGIYGEITLIFSRGAFNPLPWTYPDWASEPCRSMLAGWRKLLMERLGGAQREG